MRIPYTHNLSLMLEEMSRRDDGAVSKCLQVVLYQTLADKLWTPFKAVCFNPFVTLVVTLLLYLVFCIIYAPLWLASLLVTSYGSFAIFLVFINYLANMISRKIAFAGSNTSVQKQISSEFYRRLAMFLESIAVLISDFTAILLLGASGQIPFHEMPPMDGKLKEVVEKVVSLPSFAAHFRTALGFLVSELSVTPAEQSMLTQLCTAIEEQISALSALHPIASSYIAALENHRRANHASIMRAARTAGGQQGGAGAVPVQVPRGTPELFKVASHCLKASKALKVAVDASKPVQAPEDDGGIMSKVKSLLNLADGLEGCEKVAFPYMRCMLQQRFKVERFTLTGCDKNKIDGVIFPASALLGAGARSPQATTTGADPSAASPASPVGIVMFCSPNAGFYEGMCQSDLASSWLGYYVRLGYDVCMFNYRGYGLSTGAPEPHGIKQDACQVYTHLQLTRRPYRIILHGESIGGMVACHVARTHPVDALVCDRTFATLDATAARLLGQWAGMGLKYCTLWSTNVVRDFLACTCPKIILQDPDDEIIANLASLKNGVAMRVVLGDLSWKMLAEPQEYVYAAYLKAELPHRELEAAMLEEAGDATSRLSERFIAHFYACLVDLARRASALTSRNVRRRGSAAANAAAVASTPRRPSRVLQSEHDKSNGGAAGSTELSRRGGSANSSAGSVKDQPVDDGYMSSHSSRHDSKDFTRHGDGDESGDYDSDASSTDMMGMRTGDTWSNVEGESPNGSALREMEGGQSGDGPQRGAGSVQSPTQQMQAGQGRAPTSRREWLEQFCSTPMRDSVAAPGSAVAAAAAARQGLGPAAVTKAWAAVGRIDGGSGQLLGQALSGKIEAVRAWICAWLVWSPNASKDLSLPTGCTDVTSAIKDLRLLTDELHAAELHGDRAVQFLKNALEALMRRRDALVFHKPPLGVMLQGAMSYLQQAGGDSGGGAGEAVGQTNGAAGQTAAEQALSVGTAAATSCLIASKKCLSSNPYASIDACGDVENATCQLGEAAHGSDRSATTAAQGSLPAVRTACVLRADAFTSGEVFTSANIPSPQHIPYIGQIVALHSGHNGWPAQTEIAALTGFFEHASLA